MKDIKEITKSFKSFTDFIYHEVSDKKHSYSLTEDEALKLDEEGMKILSTKGVDMIMAKVSKIAALNILDNNVSFDIFAKLPKVWETYQTAAIALVSSEVSK